MDAAEALKRIDPADGSGIVRALLELGGPICAGVLGLDGRPWVAPVPYCLEREGALWFSTAKNEPFYTALSLRPETELCLPLENGGSLRLSGKAVFSEEAEVLSACLAANPGLQKRYAGREEYLIPFCLTEARATLRLEADAEEREWLLGTAESVLLGPRLKKDKELRDRIASLLRRREERPEEWPEGELGLVTDGALLLFAEAAKALWPRMDVQPMERAARYETYDERERYVLLAKRLYGNVTVDKPEQLTELLSPDTLGRLLEKRGEKP